MPRTVLENVTAHRKRKNALAARVCDGHSLPRMTWEALGTWAIRHGIIIELLYKVDEDSLDFVDGDNYLRRDKTP